MGSAVQACVGPLQCMCGLHKCMPSVGPIQITLPMGERRAKLHNNQCGFEVLSPHMRFGDKLCFDMRQIVDRAMSVASAGLFCKREQAS